MSDSKVNETKLAEQQARANEDVRAPQPSNGHLVLKVVGGMALALVAVGLIASANDIKRYIRISTM
ncbi:MAG TPA: hypothetical protein VLL54_10670 [Pyrinomonadaceae bacterium]|nr:hypothetical protein [Pyrinomonadaceae bacterium]